MLAFQVSFLVACFVAAFWDFIFYKIPNELIVFMIVLFALRVLLLENLEQAYIPVCIFMGTLILGYILYFFKIIGAGDAKLIAASSLWVAPQYYSSFLLLMSFAGGVLGILYYFMNAPISYVRVLCVNVLKKISFVDKGSLEEVIQAPLREGEKKKIYVPYGIAVFVGAVMVRLITV